MKGKIDAPDVSRFHLTSLNTAEIKTRTGNVRTHRPLREEPRGGSPEALAQRRLKAYHRSWKVHIPLLLS
jgi:hypothetical protein